MSFSRIRVVYKKVLFVSLAISLLFFPAMSFSQETPPCDDADPTSPACPLDNWVLFLALIAVIFAARHLYLNQKSMQHKSEQG